MDLFRWFKNKKASRLKPGTLKTDKREQKASVDEKTEIFLMLKRMASDEPDVSPDLSFFDWKTVDESVAFTDRYSKIVKRMGSSVIPDLCLALSNADPKIREKSCWALRVLGLNGGLSDDMITEMGKLIEDSDEDVRAEVLCSFGELTSSINLLPVVPHLVAGLKSEDREVRQAAVEVLGKIGSKAASTLDALRPMLDDHDVDVAEAAKTAIIKLGGKVESPASGSSEEVVRLTRLAASSEISVKGKAWADLEQLPNREAVIEPLMETFRRTGEETFGVYLPQFLGKLGTEACRTPLLEILNSARSSTDEWVQQYLVSSTCFSLISLKEGLAALRYSVSPELLQFILARGFMSNGDYDDKRLVIVAEMLSADERKKAIDDVISFFRSTNDKDWQVLGAVSDALGALGPDAIDALLEVLRGVKPSNVQPDGSVLDDDRGEDGAPSAALVRTSEGIEKLRTLCSEEEYENILVRAHEYGAFWNPSVNRALGEINSSKAIGRLVHVLAQNDWEPEDREPARKSLVKLGKNAHKQLLTALKSMAAAANPGFQTSFRREILAVLKETGDEETIPAIKTVLKSDSSVAKYAKATIEAIERRSENAE
ncbi:MAG: hypothetical protein BA863_05215 [Desulfovibrio sp. S3730MH75]|nr:MAG: hypothetical protein BA863_05215 [Desulfovibrio sp. S3730MH75]